MSTAKFLIQVLDELNDTEVKRFNFHLKFRESNPIPSGQLEDRSREEIASLLVQYYAEQAREITRETLFQVPRRDLLKMFADGKRGRSEGSKQEVEPKTLTDKTLMQLAGKMGHQWKQIGIEFLELKSYEIEQCESPNQSMVMQTFKMLNLWRNREKEAATGSRLHTILATRDCPISSEQLDCLLQK
uniref:caspase b-like isoform X2 n=1 Tax=Pristiophorus japonicus TaxID=55135 RepID=UPI00398E455D